MSFCDFGLKEKIAVLKKYPFFKKVIVNCEIYHECNSCYEALDLEDYLKAL